MFYVCAVKKHDGAVLNIASDAQLSKKRSETNVAKARPRNSTLDHNRFHKIVGKVDTQCWLHGFEGDAKDVVASM